MLTPARSIFTCLRDELGPDVAALTARVCEGVVPIRPLELEHLNGGLAVRVDRKHNPIVWLSSGERGLAFWRSIDSPGEVVGLRIFEGRPGGVLAFSGRQSRYGFACDRMTATLFAARAPRRQAHLALWRDPATARWLVHAVAEREPFSIDRPWPKESLELFRPMTKTPAGTLTAALEPRMQVVLGRARLSAATHLSIEGLFRDSLTSVVTATQLVFRHRRSKLRTLPEMGFVLSAAFCLLGAALSFGRPADR